MNERKSCKPSLPFCVNCVRVVMSFLYCTVQTLALYKSRMIKMINQGSRTGTHVGMCISRKTVLNKVQVNNFRKCFISSLVDEGVHLKEVKNRYIKGSKEKCKRREKEKGWCPRGRPTPRRILEQDGEVRL